MYFSPTERSGEQRAFTQLQRRNTDSRFMPYLNIGGMGTSFIVQKIEKIDGYHADSKAISEEV